MSVGTVDWSRSVGVYVWFVCRRQVNVGLRVYGGPGQNDPSLEGRFRGI